MKTVAIVLQLFYYINEMEKNYKKYKKMEHKIDFHRLMAAVRRELACRDLIDDDSAIEIITDTVFKDSVSESYTAEELEEIIKRLFLRTRKTMGILSPLMEDDDITEIMVNSPDEIFYEKNGKIFRYEMFFESEEEIEEIMQSVASKVHREINELNPIVDARLKDGSRVNGVYKNIAVKGPAVTIRKFSDRYMRMEDLIENGTLTMESSELLKKFVREKKNIFVSGGTSSGKTTLLNALGQFIGKQERVIVIEDSAELKLNYMENMVQLECRHANSSGKGDVSMSDLIKASLRMRPDRIIVGEVRGEEVLDMIQAMNTGHSGSMSTGHGNSSEAMLKRLETMYLMAVTIDVEAIRAQIAEAIDVMIHVEKTDKGRRITEISQLSGYSNGTFTLKKLMTLKDGVLTGETEIKEGESKNG